MRYGRPFSNSWLLLGSVKVEHVSGMNKTPITSLTQSTTKYLKYVHLARNTEMRYLIEWAPTVGKQLIQNDNFKHIVWTIYFPFFINFPVVLAAEEPI